MLAVTFLILLASLSLMAHSKSPTRRRAEEIQLNSGQEKLKLKLGGVPREKRQRTDQNLERIGSRGNQRLPTESANHENGLPYNFTYQVNEKDTQFSQKVKSNGEVVTGEYRVLMSDGRTQIVSYVADWKNGYNAKVRYEGTARPYVPPKRRPGESEQDSLPVGFGLCPPGYSRRRGESRCRPNPIDEQETDILPEGQRPSPPKKISIVCPPRHIMSPLKNRCVPADEAEEAIQPVGQWSTTSKPCSAAIGKGFASSCPPDEQEQNIQPGGYLPNPSHCPPGYSQYPGKGIRNCHPIITTTRQPIRETRAPSQSISAPGKLETGNSAENFEPTAFRPCPLGFKLMQNGQCHRIPPRQIQNDKEKCVAEQRDPRICFPELCFPGSKHPRCNQHLLKPGPVDESEEDIQAAGRTLSSTPATVDDIQLAEAECLRKNKDPRVCFPELCYPGSSHTKCQTQLPRPIKQQPKVDDLKEAALPAGAFPMKPKNLYNTPDTPFGERLHRKFGY